MDLFWRSKVKILYILLTLISGTAGAAVCSRTLSFVDGSVLTAAQLNNEFNAITNCANSLDNANIITAANILPIKIDATIAYPAFAILRDGVTGGLKVNVDGSTIEISSNALQIKDGGVTVSKLASNSVTTAKIVDSNVTFSKMAIGAVPLKTQTFTSSGTWTAPANCTSILVYGFGGGGGGGAGFDSDPKGGGGGGGAMAFFKILTVVPSTVYNIVVGAGGTGSTSNGAGAGSNGGSSFFHSLVEFPGGFGGTNSNSAIGIGGATGKIRTYGGNGGSNSAVGLAGELGVEYSGGSGGAPAGTCGGGGGGGGGAEGIGGNGATLTTNAVAGSGFGAGGGGGACGAVSDPQRPGGNGSPGKIIVMWTGP